MSTATRRVLPAEAIHFSKRVAARPLSRRLDVLAALYGTDKAPSIHNYTRVYQSYFSAIRNKVRTVVEVGIGGSDTPDLGGNSLRMWRTYFPGAHIIGIDLYPKSINESRITTIIADQSDVATLERIACEFGPFDIVIDDGSHIGRLTANTFDVFYPHVRLGGYYAIEDTNTSYSEEYEGGPIGTRDTAVSLVQSLVHRVHLDPEDVGPLHVYNNLTIIERSRSSSR